jgi:hypothetical protein
MSNIRLSELELKTKPSINDSVLVYDSENKKTVQMTIPSLLGLALNTPCKYCGSRGHYDRRGNCGSCGAPIIEEKND